MSANRWMRASDQDRDRAAELLCAAYAVGRLTRDELEDRAASAYSARTWGELRELTADLPVPPVSAGLPSDLVTSRGAAPKTRAHLIGRMAWIIVLVLVPGLAGLVIPMALWVAAVLIPLVLLLPPAIGISRRCRVCGEAPGRRRNGDGERRPAGL